MTGSRHALIVGIDRYPHLPERYQLEGAVRDAELARRVLGERFGFEDPVVLLDERATRAAILRGMETLIARARPGDEVLFHFSGHGSQRPDRDGDEADGLDETLAPHDRGADGAGSRDLVDDEIHRWLVELTAITERVVLIVDSCHSGSMARHPAAAKVRHAPAPGVGGSPTRRSVGWLSPATLGLRYTLIAACADDEAAHEDPDDLGASHGALSRVLYRALARAGASTTFRQVFEEVAARVTARYPLQHPRLEGARDRLLFGDTPRPERSTFVLFDEHQPPDTVSVELGPALDREMPRVATLVERSPVLRRENGDAELRLIRVTRGSEPAAWAILGRDGAVRPPVVTDDQPDLLVSNLETWARALRTLEMEDPGPSGRLRGRIELDLLTGTPDGGWHHPEGPLEVVEEQRVAFEIRNHAHQAVYVTLLVVGIDGAIDPIYPPAGTVEPLRPGEPATDRRAPGGAVSHRPLPSAGA